jgi:hypothetical protein
MNPSTTDVTIHATTIQGSFVTVKTFDVIIQNGQPLIVFFVVDENGNHAIFNQHELTNYIER